MKISISNLAFRGVELASALSKLQSNQINGIEMAPSLVFENYLSPKKNEISKVKKMLSEYEIEVSALQSIFFGKPEFQMLDRAQHATIRDHLKRVISLAKAIGTSKIVLGSPKNRIRSSMEVEEAHKVLRELFELIIPDLEDCGVTVLIEPNARYYGADYLINYLQCVDLVRECNSPWIENQIDTGCQILENEDLVKSIYLRKPAHVHLSAKDLKGVFPNEATENVIQTLKTSCYTNWITIEMLGDLEPGLDESILNAIIARKIWNENE